MKKQFQFLLAGILAFLMSISLVSPASAAGWNTKAYNAYGSYFSVTVYSGANGTGKATSLAPGRWSPGDVDSFRVTHAGPTCRTYLNGSAYPLAKGIHNTTWHRQILIIGICG